MTFQKGEMGKGEEGKNKEGEKVLKPNIQRWHLKQLPLGRKNKNKERFNILFSPIKQYVPS